ncbi:ester cyclase [Sinomicrobium sp. M5D2P17]
MKFSNNMMNCCLLLLLLTTGLKAQQRDSFSSHDPKNPGNMPAMYTPDKNKEIIQRFYKECLNTGNTDILPEFVSGDYTGLYKGKNLYGPAGYAETVKEIFTGFPDIHFTIETLIAEGDRIVIQWTSEGTHRHTAFGIPATGKKVTNKAVTVYKLRDGKIIENQVYPDRLGVLQQIGAIPKL